MKVLLISTYELGRQPFGLASPAAWLRAVGHDVQTVDASREQLTNDAIRSAGVVAFYLPMHTATRLAIPLIERVRREHPPAHLCCYGLYASLNRSLLESLGVSSVLGGEFERDLTEVVNRIGDEQRCPLPTSHGSEAKPAVLPRLEFRVPSRVGLPALTRYAALELGGGQRRTVGYTEASRGCKHLCRHCPIVPVYEGQFRVVQREVVLEDIRQQVEQGAEHITFGDPDFFNGVGHATRIVEDFARSFPGVTYDVTIKVQHLRAHADRLSTLAATGCLLVTSAVESFDDHILAILEKGHTREDVVRVVELCRAAGLALAPTFVPFTPWTTMEGYCDLLNTVEQLELVEAIAPVQFAIRLLLPSGSCLLARADVQARIGPFEPNSLMFPWRHVDERVDDLHRDIAVLVARHATGHRRDVFDAISALAHDRTGLTRRQPSAAPNRATVPYLNEPWYC
jgi:radical SAM superfamily enzyme YgiQ (UPF0313 family)